MTTATSRRRRVPVWPIWVLSAPAAVSIWAGWVGLGQLTGFGVVALLPGIWDELRINTAITLPIGMETYAAYGPYIWLATEAPARAKQFARTSALGALILGALGQMAYHLMAAADVTESPWPITAAVSCLPVGVLGMAAALAHLVRSEDDARDQANPTAAAPVSAPLVPSPAHPFRTVTPAPAHRAGASAPPLRAVPHWSTASSRAAAQAADPPSTPTPTGPPDQPPDRPSGSAQPTPAGRPTDRSADRSAEPAHAGGPDRSPARPVGRSSRSRSRARKPRTDDQLAQAVRQLAETTGEPPSQYQLKQKFGIGSARAARLLADLHTTAAPSTAGVTGPNGAVRKESTP